MKTCLIISGGDFSPCPDEIEYDLAIACDRGYEHAKMLGIVPNLLLGDFDSMEEPGELSGIKVLRYPVQKDDSDTMLAIRYALDQGFNHIVILCALGGRADHTLANIQSMAYAASCGAWCEIITDREYMRTFTGGELLLERRMGESLSLFALTDACTHVSISGAAYPAEDITLNNTFPLGLSNKWADDTVRITMESGIMLIVCSHLP